jgi:hypothetical protein
MRLPEPRVVAELVRLPAVLSVPGDTLLGAAAAGAPMTPLAVAGRAAASSCLYLGGMALNDYADREVDAAERPHRPIPSGRVDEAFALRLAQALTVGGLALSGLVGGRRTLGVGLALAGTVWAYDLALKDTPAGPVAMAGCRALDVAMGASGGALRHALVPAAAVACHTLTITLVSRHEARGGTPEVARRSLWGTAAVSTLAGAQVLGSTGLLSRPVPGRGPAAGGRGLRRGAGSGPPAPGGVRGWASTAVSGGLLAAYAATMGRAAVRATRDPSPARLQQVVGAGVLGFMPLEGALLSGVRRTATGMAVAAGWPLARHLARRRAVT